jgi:16S rRNA (guanine966-N2)-methyltransferase
MRIIAGTSKGKNLFSPTEKTRPTSDRAREGLFSSLESEFGSMSELNFLDLFSGSGAVGVEAFSRGAANVYSIEDHAPTAGIASKNFGLVKSEAGKFTVVTTSAERFVATPHQISFDIIFMDPPYDVENSVIEKILIEINSNNLLKRNGIIAIERETKKSQFSWPQPFIEEKVRSYGQGSIFYGGYSASVLP